MGSIRKSTRIMNVKIVESNRLLDLFTVALHCLHALTTKMPCFVVLCTLCGLKRLQTEAQILIGCVNRNKFHDVISK